MGQQLPLYPNGQGAYGSAVPTAQPGAPSQPFAMPGVAQPNPAMAAQGVPGATPNAGIQGVDPRMMAAAQQSLANPNGGDFSNILPGPESLLKGAGLGAGVALGMGYLSREDVNFFNKTAKFIDRFPGAKLLRDKIDPQMQEWAKKNNFLNEFLMPDAHLTEKATPADIEKAIATTVSKMEQRHLTGVLGAYQKKFAKQPQDLQTAYKNTLKALEAKGHGNTYLKALPSGTVVHPKANFAGVLADLEKQLKHLEAQKKHLRSLPTNNKAEIALNKKLHKTLRNVKERISGIDRHYKPLYHSQAELSAKLSAEGVGPVGRSFASFTNYLTRIFNGSTMGMGGKKAAEGVIGEEAQKTALQKTGAFIAEKGKGLLGPLFVGAGVFGFSFHAAHNAKDGEKTKTFFHNFLGSQIFNFIGWEFGRKVLNSMEIGTKVFGKIAGKTLPGFLSKIPLIGGITLAGFGTEIAAMLIFGTLFQKVGEKLSGAIFGKPSQESIDGKGNKQNQQNQANPALAGMMNPALMNQAQQANAAPNVGRAQLQRPQQAQNPAYPSQARGTAVPAANASSGQQLTGAAQPPGPKFSITPQEISNSKVASDYDNAYKSLKADKSLDKQVGSLLDQR